MFLSLASAKIMLSISYSSELNIFISTQLRELVKDKTSENLISCESLLDRFRIPKNVLWECLLTLKIEPQQRNEQAYFTTQDLKRLEQFIKRIEISWACPHILETCS